MKSESESSPQQETLSREKKVLAISEMALIIDGNYLGEIGNPSYRPNEKMFEYDPKGGLLINTGKTELLEPDDLIKLPEGYGFVSIDWILDGRKGVYSESKFEGKLYEKFRQIREKLEMIGIIAKDLGITWDLREKDYFLHRAFAQNKQFSPEELYQVALDILEDEIKRNFTEEEIEKKGIANISENIQRTEILNLDEKTAKKGMVSYFYLHCRLQDVNASDPEELKKAIDEFRFADRLMEEYKTRPDSRFGDELLVACSLIEKEMESEN